LGGGSAIGACKISRTRCNQCDDDDDDDDDGLRSVRFKGTTNKYSMFRRKL